MNKVLIRPLEIEDAKVSFRWRNDHEIWQYTGAKPSKIITEEIEENWLTEKLAEKNSRRFGIIVDDRYIGNIQVTDIIDKEKGQYHIFIGEKSYWNKGIAKLATYQIIRYSKQLLKLKQLYLKVDPNHNTAIKLYEKCGFVKDNDEIVMKLDLTRFSPPILSVFVITFNHEQFILKAIEGILMQKAKFDFDIVIGDDCSTDKTRLIIQSIADKYPGKFNLIFHKSNLGAIENQIATLNGCTGKYIAFCEGDDYWIDPNKLQKQVDYMEENQEVSLCFTNAKILLDKSKVFKDWPITLKSGYYEPSEIMFDLVIPTCSVVIKNLISQTISNRLLNRKYIMGDLILWLSIAEFGKLYCINEQMVVYRKNESSIAFSLNLEKQIQLLQQHEEIYKDFSNKYETYEKKFLSRQYLIVGLKCLFAFDSRAITYLGKALTFQPSRLPANILYMIKRFFVTDRSI